jgi:hypothetical protein
MGFYSAEADIAGGQLGMGSFALGTQYTQTSSEKRPEISTRKPCGNGANLGPKLVPYRPPIWGFREAKATDSTGLLVGAVGIEIASLLSKSTRANGVAPPPDPNWSLLEPDLAGGGSGNSTPSRTSERKRPS